MAINRVYNGDFTIPSNGFVDGWVPTRGNAATSWSVVNNQIKITNPSYMLNMVGVIETSKIPVQPGEIWLYQAYFRGENNGLNLRLAFHFYNTNGNPAGFDYFGAQSTTYLQQYEGYINVPQGAALMAPEVGFQDTGTIYIDNVSMERVKPQFEPAIAQVGSRSFTNLVESELITTDSYQFTSARDTSQQRIYTFFVLNTGSNPVTIQPQVSPNNSDWVDDSAELSLNVGEGMPVLPRYFLHFTRVKYKSANAGQPTTVVIWYQAQV